MKDNKILLIAGTRPNFIKLAPLYHQLKTTEFVIKICHTGQHYDKNMSDSFWESLQIPEPDFNLNVRGNSVPEIIGKTTIKIGKLLSNEKFNLAIVFGDVNATAAGAIAAVQLRVPVLHVESGLRSYDRDMPEENNRIITDHISDFLMVSENSGLENLKKEGINDEKVFFVGNIMIECLLMTKKKWENIILDNNIIDFMNNQKVVVATFHRPENVDKKKDLTKIVNIITTVASKKKVILPLHPRTRNSLEKHDLLYHLKQKNILLTEPKNYFSFLHLVSKSDFVITDSGGIQEETSFLKIPCITFRKNTERPVTIDLGTNILLDINEQFVLKKIESHINSIPSKIKEEIPLWDINVSNRIVEIIKNSILHT